jgi:RNA 3'-terminal phosphate cyclase
VVVDSGGSVDVVKPPSSVVVFGVSGGSVASVSSGPTEITFSPPATHALVTIDIANTTRISLFTAAILGIGPL